MDQYFLYIFIFHIYFLPGFSLKRIRGPNKPWTHLRAEPKHTCV
jgi:hypothetical protein